jgi:gluconolactonase
MFHKLNILWGILAIANAAALISAAETREVKIEDLKLTVPATWKQQEPSNNLRLGQFEIPAADGDKESAELTIFNFGAGGGVKANLDRWVEQFQPAERKTKASQGKGQLGEYVLVDISGTYKKPIGPPRLNKTEPMPGARMLGVILSVEKKGLYFLKLTGPDKTVSAALGALRTAIGGKESEEKPYDLNKAAAKSE